MGKLNYHEIAKSILNNVGGSSNVEDVTHCATRLRIVLQDRKIPETEAIKQLDGIIGVVNGEAQYQVIIGQEVGKVYDEFQQLLSAENNSIKGPVTETSKAADHEEPETSKLSAFLAGMAAIFSPIIPAMTAGGFIKAIMYLLQFLGVISTKSDTYILFYSVIGDAPFYFMPFLLAYGTAKKFKANPALALLMAGILLHPGLAKMYVGANNAVASVHLFGFLPVTQSTYTASVLPIILTVIFMSYVQKYLEKISPELIKFFIVRCGTIAITSIVALVVIGPMGTFVGEGFADLINFLDSTASWLCPTIIGAFMPFLVMTGTHYAIVPIGVMNLTTFGIDRVVGPGGLTSNLSTGSAALGVAAATKDIKLKTLGTSAGLSALLGITEPALYGVNLQKKYPLIATMVGGAVGGLYLGLTHAGRFATGPAGLLLLPGYLGGDSIYNFVNACVGSMIAIIVSFIISYMLCKKDEKDRLTDDETTGRLAKKTVLAPLSGTVKELSEVNDAIFSAGLVGKGVAILPTDEKIIAPFDGEIVMVAETKHAIGLKSTSGIELLIHIGIDTFKLNGNGFDVKVEQQQKVKAGEPLVVFDKEVLEAEGLDPIVLVIITNSEDFDAITYEHINETVQAREPLLLA